MSSSERLNLDAIRKRADAAYADPYTEPSGPSAVSAEVYELLGHDIPALLDEVERLRPRQNGNGSTHWDGCWESRGHHDCAVAEIERLKQEIRDRGNPR